MNFEHNGMVRETEKAIKFGKTVLIFQLFRFGNKYHITYCNAI